MANHEHVEMLGNRVDRKRASRIGRGGQNVQFAADFDNVRRMTATRAFGMEGVDSAAFKRGNRIVHETRFIDGVGVNGDLHIVFFGNGKAVVNRGE